MFCLISTFGLILYRIGYKIMPASMINFPIANIVDALLSYTQHLFANTDLTPADYRWSSDDRMSKIRICAPFVIDNEKPMSAPFIVIERGGFEFEDRVIDNLKSANENTFQDPNYVTICNGYVNVTVGAGVAQEASSIANFLALMYQADRHGIIKVVNFLRNLKHTTVGPEIPVIKDTEVRRWEVTVTIFVSLQMGWISTLSEPVPWTKFAMYGIKAVDTEPLSSSGVINAGSDLLYDGTKNFGLTTSDDPQFLEQELTKKWYYIRFNNLTSGEPSQLYPVAEIVDEHTLRLLSHDVNNAETAWSAPESQTDVEYELYWNNVHLYVEVPKV
jgi:hypothetical protein